jgi:hypothetical protein
MDTWIQPEVELLKDTFIDISYPDEIILPGFLNQSSSLVNGVGYIPLPCDQIQGYDFRTLKCWRVIQNSKLTQTIRLKDGYKLAAD